MQSQMSVGLWVCPDPGLARTVLIGITSYLVHISTYYGYICPYFYFHMNEYLDLFLGVFRPKLAIFGMDPGL